MAGAHVGSATDQRAELEVHHSRGRRTRIDGDADVEHARRADALVQQHRRRRPRGPGAGGRRDEGRRADRQCRPGEKERSENFECGPPPQHTRRIGSMLEGCNGCCKPWTPVLTPRRQPAGGMRERSMAPSNTRGERPREGRGCDGDLALERSRCPKRVWRALGAILPSRCDVSTGARCGGGPSLVLANLHGLSRRGVAKRTRHVDQSE